jgi:hypothetical protein
MLTKHNLEHAKLIISDFAPISLSEMDQVKLMSRNDTKFIFHISKLENILKNLKNDYKILEINEKRLSEYETLYYDTNKLDLYLKHHNGKGNRFKIRCRRYVGSGLNFLEIKHKNNKSRTIKSRIKLNEITAELSSKSKKFIQTITGLDPEKFGPVCWINYYRITLVNNNMQERLTLDVGLTLKNNDKQKVFEPLVVAELKQDKASTNSLFMKVMQEKRIKRYSLSKYCLGVIELFPSIKKNNFKPKLLTLKKMLYVNS